MKGIFVQKQYLFLQKEVLAASVEAETRMLIAVMEAGKTSFESVLAMKVETAL